MESSTDHVLVLGMEVDTVLLVGWVGLMMGRIRKFESPAPANLSTLHRPVRCSRKCHCQLLLPADCQRIYVIRSHYNSCTKHRVHIFHCSWQAHHPLSAAPCPRQFSVCVQICICIPGCRNRCRRVLAFPRAARSTPVTQQPTTWTLPCRR